MVTRELVDLIATGLQISLERNSRDALVQLNDNPLEGIGSDVMIDGHINLREIALDLVPLLYAEAKKHWTNIDAEEIQYKDKSRMNVHQKLTQTGDMERFQFIGNDNDGRVKMELWLKGQPEPSTSLNLDVRDALSIKQALDSVLRRMGKIE